MKGAALATPRLAPPSLASAHHASQNTLCCLLRSVDSGIIDSLVELACLAVPPDFSLVRLMETLQEHYVCLCHACSSSLSSAMKYFVNSFPLFLSSFTKPCASLGSSNALTKSGLNVPISCNTMYFSIILFFNWLDIWRQLSLPVQTTMLRQDGKPFWLELATCCFCCASHIQARMRQFRSG